MERAKFAGVYTHDGAGTRVVRYSWEQRKLGDIFEEYSEKDHAELPALTIIQGGGTIRRDESDRALQYDKKSLSNYKKVDVGDFIVHLRSFEGGLEMATNTGIVSPAYHIFHGEKVDSRFYYSYFRSKQFINTDLKPHVYGIRDGRSIDIEGMKTIEIPWTILDEQKAIGNCIDTLDHLITLHQRKLEKLKLVKKSMLEKMFPKNGSSVPEIRFKGFTDDWEQRKLGDVVKEITRNDPESEAPIMMITANNGFIEQSERYAFNNAGESLKKYILLKKGELAYNHGASKLRPYGSCFALTAAENARIPFVYHCFSAENQNAEFMSIELNGAEIENQLRRIVSSGARMDGLLNISFDEYTSVSVLLPSAEEQDRIADFFHHLDNLITLHQRKVEKLKILKKSMLEKMFV